ncbi:DUF3502 domain-containing protein [Butyrivibrio sp. XB500-5]|uniref:ABC transporter substrate-binding protein n=1 Tax=Butyrivibrio sp. XB500-5 TaxID=2364880 RepID=UPI000EA8BC67|nr:ABC transporter substrate-binding protein [Butyrivibrio sp. XB500-5]RKM58540.1 DUF3502 domain-containing protein [Butyrivibrio sp. XB500-5]
MRGKFTSLLLTGALLTTLLTGCGMEFVSEAEEYESDAVIPKSGDLVADIDFEKAAKAITERKAMARQTGEYQTVVVAFFDWTGRPVGTDRISAAISAHTEETLGLDVELRIFDSSQYGDDMKVLLSSEGQVDLFTSAFLGYNACFNDGYALDLEQNGLFDDYCAGLKSKVRDEYLDACRIGGTLYGTPPIKDYAIETCAVCIGKEYLDGIGYNADGLPKGELGYPKATWSEINDIYAQLHEKYPDKYVIATQDNILTQGSTVDNLGGDYFGTLLDPENSLVVKDVFSSDVFKEWCLRTYEWNNEGYIAEDALTNNQAASAKVKSGAYMSLMAACKPGYKTQISGECGREMVVFDVGESFMSSSAVSNFPWCVNRDSQDPIAAMQVLDALYTDPYIENLICWGEEGVDYKLSHKGTITFADGVDANTSEYYPNVLWLMPNPYIAYVWKGDSPDLGQEISDFNDNCECRSLAIGFTWDNTNYAAQCRNLQEAYDEFAPQLIHGFIEPEEGIERLETALKAAGLEDYMEAKQRALNAWANENNIY